MRTLFTSAAFFFAFVSYSFSANYYFLVDPSCMDKLQYELGFGSAASQDIVYSFKVNSAEKILLEVGQATPQTVNSLDGEVIRCTNRNLSPSQKAALKSPANRVFVVRALTTQNSGYTSSYEVFPVHSVGILKADANAITLDHWKYSFDFSADRAQPGSVLPGTSSGGNIIFQGTAPAGCLMNYTFRQSFSFQQGAYIDLKIIPEIGIIEEASSNPGSGMRELKQVNDRPLSEAINLLCSNNQTAYNAQPPAPAPASRGMNNSVQEKTHTVEKGETLWAISRKYNTKVDDLKSWNSLTSNEIRVGQTLVVGKSQSAAFQPVAEPQPSMATRSPANTSTWTTPPPPVPTDLYQASQPAWRTTNGWHKVSAGETVASIAMKYGYTEARFRDMNQLGPAEVVRVNQYLKTTDCDINQNQQPSGTPGNAFKSLNTSTSMPAEQPAETGPVDFDPYGSSGPQFSSSSSPANQPPVSTSLPTEYGSNPPSNFDISRPAEPTNTANPANTGSPFTLPTYNNANQPASRGGRSGSLSYDPSGQAAPPSSNQFTTPATRGGASAMTPKGTSARFEPAKPMGGNPQAADIQSVSGTHVVQPGESMASIAQRYGISVNKLMQLNKLSPGEVIIPYQRLYVQ